MRWMVLGFLVLVMVFLVSCGGGSGYTQEGGEPAAEAAQASAEETSVPLAETTETSTEEVMACTHNSNCTGGKYCIGGKCELLGDLTEGNCKTCKFTRVEVLTSDGELYNLTPGQGSYTAASALEWDVLSGPAYCQGEKAGVPFKVLKRNYGTVFSEEVILVKAGETSEVIKHPVVKKLAFTLKVNKVEEACP